jgi:MtrB/PioB family decaheme-associated outer membrane protein
MGRLLARFSGPMVVFVAAAGLSATALAQGPPAQVATPPPAEAAQPAPSGPLGDGSRSLFEPGWNMLQLSGRWSSVAGDPARWQRYEDLRDGLLFTNGRYLQEKENWNLTAGADNVGWRDQRYFANYERKGRFRVSGLWDQIPQFYSVDTRTPFVEQGDGVLVLDDSVQRAVQSQGATLSAYVPISPQFDLHERRDIGSARVSATPSLHLDLTGGFTTTNHSGGLPWGGSFGFGNNTEVSLPYRSRTNDVDLGAQWSNSRSMVRAAYNGSWFNNQDDTLVWDSPLTLTDGVELPGRGRTALWPSNSFQTLSAAGYTKFARRTQLTGSLAFGWANNDEALLPFTINTALPTLALPRATAEASAQTISANVNFVTRPADDWRFSGRFRRFDYNNDMPATAIPQMVSYDSDISDTPTGGPDLFAHDRNTLDAEATWSGLPVALTVGYTNNHNGYDFRTFESTNENVLHLKADAVSAGGVNFRARYELGSRSGSGFDETSLTSIGEYPGMRHFDLADRTRSRFLGQVDMSPTEALTFSVGAGFGDDDFDESTFGLQEAAFRNVTFGIDLAAPGGFGVGGSYDYERYSGLQRSRSASPGVQQEDPNRDWSVDSKEVVHYFSIYVYPPRFKNKTETRLSYNYAHARSDFVYEVGPALPPPSQLPRVFNKQQNLRLDVRHRLTGQFAATFSYAYEPYRIYDFAFDPSVIDGIVQPSSLVLGYTYRPYTTHSAVFGILYYW